MTKGRFKHIYIYMVLILYETNGKVSLDYKFAPPPHRLGGQFSLQIYFVLLKLLKNV